MLRKITPFYSRSRSLPVAVAAVCSIFILGSPSAFADVSWDGGASTNKWLDGANWSGDAVPGSGSGNVTIGTGASVILDGSAPSLNTSLRLFVQGGSSLDVTSGVTTVGNLAILSQSGNAGSLKVSGGTLNYATMGGNAGFNGGNVAITSGTLSSVSTAAHSMFGNLSISGGSWLIGAASGSNTALFGYYGVTNVAVSGGNFLINRTVVAGRDDASNGGPVNVTITSGTFSSTKFSQIRGQIDVSGGKFTTSGNFEWAGTQRGAPTNRVLRVTGGVGDVTIGGNFVTTGSTGNREFVLTAKNSGVAQENISKITVTGTDSAGGNVNVSLQGGVLMGSPTTYTLIDAGTLVTSGSSAITYIGSNVYTGAAVGNQYQIALNAAQDKGDLALSQAAPIADEAFTLSSTGYVNVDLSSVIDDPTLSLLVRLDANAGTKSLDDMVTFLSQSGYSDVTLDSFGDYDISFTIDHNFLSSGSMYFGWDFSQFDATAGLTGVQIVSSVPEPGTVGLLSIAGLSLVLWRRRRS